MRNREKKYLLFPDTLIVNGLILVIIVVMLYYLYRYITPTVQGFFRTRVAGACCSGLLTIYMLIAELPLSILWIKIFPEKLVWKSSLLAKPLPYPSERIIAIKIYFGVHALDDDHSRAYSKYARAVIYPRFLPTLAIYHRKRMVALCCRFRKKLFLQLVECCPNAKITVVTKKNRPIPKRYQEFLAPYLTNQDITSPVAKEEIFEDTNDIIES